MTPEQHLNAIVAKCRANLALAEKRITGKWEAGNGAVWDNDAERAPQEVCEFVKDHDAAYIAACAGAAEAGWRSTIAAIDSLSRVRQQHGRINDATLPLEFAILAAWPEELL